MSTENENLDYESRVKAVKDFAKANYDRDGWDRVVETMTDWDIYHKVKYTRSDEGAIKKMAQVINAPHEYRMDIINSGDLEATKEPVESGIKPTKITLKNTRQQLAYYMETKPSDSDVRECAEWRRMNPDTGVDQWVSAMMEIDGL